MGAATYTAKVIVLRKTKLGESDLILTLLAEDGEQLRAVAKGARKPTNTFSSRLELYSVAEVLCSKGRTLDIVKEARLIASNEKLRVDMLHSAGAAVMCELLDKVTQMGLSNAKLFAMTQVAFVALSQASSSSALSITGAHVLKVLAFSGFRPSLETCASCGSLLPFEEQPEVTPLSYREGGVLCEICRNQGECVYLQKNTLQWIHFLLTSTFEDIEKEPLGLTTAYEVLRFCQMWVKEHVSANLKSLNFIFSSGIYETED